MRKSRSVTLVVATAFLAVAADGAVPAVPPVDPAPWLCTVQQQELVVGTSAELHKALKEVPSGGTLSLQTGSYGTVRIRNFHRDHYVVIRSADPSRPAVVESLNVRNSDHLWFQQLLFATPEKPRGKGTALVKVREASDIGFAASEFHGSVDGDYTNDPLGVRVHGADRFVFAANRVHDLTRGIGVHGVRKGRVSGNRFFDLRSDGADFSGVQDIVIDGNFFTRFHPLPKDHPDFIQFWQRNAMIEDTRGVVIRRNTFLQGSGSPTQTIFIGNKIAGRVYRDFLIEDNVIYNAHPHGISLHDVDGAKVVRNTLVAFPGGNKTLKGGNFAPRINLFGVSNVEVVANVAPALKTKKAMAIRQEGNLFTGVKFLNTAQHLEPLFAEPGAQAMATAKSLAPRPGGMLDRPEDKRIGALSARPDAARPAVRAEFGNEGCPRAGQHRSAP